MKIRNIDFCERAIFSESQRKNCCGKVLRQFDIMHPARVPQKIAMESPKFCEIKVAVCFTKNGIAKVAVYIQLYIYIYIYIDR